MSSLLRSINVILFTIICIIAVSGFIFSVLGASEYFWISMSRFIETFPQFLPIVAACIVMNFIVEKLLGDRK